MIQAIVAICVALIFIAGFMVGTTIEGSQPIQNAVCTQVK